MTDKHDYIPNIIVSTCICIRTGMQINYMWAATRVSDFSILSYQPKEKSTSSQGTYINLHMFCSIRIINPRRTCTARVTVLGLYVGLFVCLSVCLSTTILVLQAMRWFMSDTNRFSATRARKLMWKFC